MSWFQRLKNVVIGLCMILCAVLLLAGEDDGCFLVMLILAFSLIVRGISELIYYVTMARHMVGGKLILFIGVVLVDFGIFTISLADESKVVVVLYLIGFHAFAGLINLLRAREAMRYKSSAWRINMAQGVTSLLILAASLIFARDQGMLVLLYCAGLVYSAFLRIYSAFQRTAIVYIQ